MARLTKEQIDKALASLNFRVYEQALDGSDNEYHIGRKGRDGLWYTQDIKYSRHKAYMRAFELGLVDADL